MARTHLELIEDWCTTDQLKHIMSWRAEQIIELQDALGSAEQAAQLIREIRADAESARMWRHARGKSVTAIKWAVGIFMAGGGVVLTAQSVYAIAVSAGLW